MISQIGPNWEFGKRISFLANTKMEIERISDRMINNKSNLRILNIEEIILGFSYLTRN